MKIAAILVNWNAKQLTLNCIQSIIKTGYSGVSIIIVDNGSHDNSVEEIKQKYNTVVLIQNTYNMGFCVANNQAIKYALDNGYDIIVILNNDTIVEYNFFEKCITRIEKSSGSIVTPKIYFLNRPSYFWFVLGKKNLWTGLFSNPLYKEKDNGQINFSCEMDFAVGCCIAARSAVFQKIGGFDESFFMYCEDLDWSLRAQKEGYKIVLEPDAKIYHHVSFSGDKESAIRRYYLTRNHLWVLRRHSEWYHYLVWIPLVPFRSAFRIIKLIINRNFKGICYEVKGVLHGLFYRIPMNHSVTKE